LCFLEFNVISYLFFGQIFLILLLIGIFSFRFFGFVVSFKVFGFNLDVQYFLRNTLKVLSSFFFVWFFGCIGLFFVLFFVFLVRDFLGFLFLGGLFFVLLQMSYSYFLAFFVVFYSLIFSLNAFFVFFVFPFCVIFWVKTFLRVETFFVVLAPLLSYMRYTLMKPSALSTNLPVFWLFCFGLILL